MSPWPVFQLDGVWDGSRIVAEVWDVCVSSGGDSFDMSDVAERVNDLKKDITRLDNEERRLDQDRVVIDYYVNQITADLTNQK